MTAVVETQELVQEKPKLDVLQKEKMRKEAIANTKYQTQFAQEQNKLMRAQNERMRLQIEEQELSARSWKAWHDKMFYSIECERLEPMYKEYQKRTEERIAEERKKQEEAQKQAQESAGIESDVPTDKIPEVGDLTIDNLSNEE